MSGKKRSKLFDLFRDYRTYEIEDTRNGMVVPIAFKSLEHLEQMRLMEQLESIRRETRKKVDTDENREFIKSQLVAAEKPQCIDALVAMERITALTNADLAPKVEGESETDVVTRWEGDRRTALETSDVEVLRAMLADRQLHLNMTSLINNRFTEISLAKLVVDPDTKEPIFSDDPASEDYIGRLMPATRAMIVDRWNQFLKDQNEQAVRRASQDPGFQDSGRSAGNPADGPGATTETPPDSQQPSLVSTRSDSGSTT